MIRLAGVIPDGARTFSWSYRLAFASYSLSVRQGASVSMVMVEGAEPSTPVPLTNAVVAEHRLATRTWHVVLLACLVALVGWRARPLFPRLGERQSNLLYEPAKPLVMRARPVDARTPGAADELIVRAPGAVGDLGGNVAL